MTIAISCNLADGVVLGADSRLTVTGSMAKPRGDGGQEMIQGVLTVYNDAEKLFPLGDLPAGILTYGLAILGKRTLRSYIREFETSADINGEGKTKTLKSISEELQGFFRTKLESIKAEERPGLGLIVAGFSPGEDLSEVWEIRFRPRENNPQPLTAVRDRGVFGANWFAEIKPVSRLIKGYDPQLVNPLVNLILKELAITAVPSEKKGELQKKVNEFLSNFEYRTIFDGMPLQEGIYYVKFLLETAINQSRFTIGVPTCGGDINMALVLKDGYKPVNPKEFVLVEKER